MGSKNVIVGQRFGRLVVLCRSETVLKRSIMWLCQCDCGNESTVRGSSLLRGDTRSCGCLAKEMASRAHTVHGMRHDPLYTVWANMKNRCNNPKFQFYANYGGRGIRVCDEWQRSFEAFYFYAAQLPHFGEDGYSLDRILNDGNYEPGNVRYATATEQGRNKGNNHMLTHDGKTRSVTEWEVELSLPKNVLSKRLRAGWSVERALTTPVQDRPQGRRR